MSSTANRRRCGSPVAKVSPTPGSVDPRPLMTSSGAPHVDDDVRVLVERGIVGRPGAFARAWVEEVRADVDREFLEARGREGGALPRGPERWYVEIHPEQLRGFVDLASHPWITAVCSRVLGPDYTIVELGFDTSLPGARDQPWHRDFPSHPDVYEQHRITSLAFNLTCVDMDRDMGAMEVAPGTQWEPGLDWTDGMFPPPGEAPRYASRAERSYPHMGDVTARTALTVHRGTANRSTHARPVLVMGVDAPGAGHRAKHDLQMTQQYHASLDEELRSHVDGRLVPSIEPIVQKHVIEGLLDPYTDAAPGQENG
jgi:hypothetical protein